MQIVPECRKGASYVFMAQEGGEGRSGATCLQGRGVVLNLRVNAEHMQGGGAAEGGVIMCTHARSRPSLRPDSARLL